MDDVTKLPMRDDLPEHFRPVAIERVGEDQVRVQFPNGRIDVIPDWQFAAWFVKDAS